MKRPALIAAALAFVLAATTLAHDFVMEERSASLLQNDAIKHLSNIPRFFTEAWIDEIHAQWLLVEGARPGNDFTTMTWVGLLLAFSGVNLWLLVRGLLAMLRA